MAHEHKEHWDRYQEIGYQISYCRKRMKMTQEEMAEKLNVSRQHIGAIEAPNVNRKISLDLIFDIADLFGVEPKFFLEYQKLPMIKHTEDGVVLEKVEEKPLKKKSVKR